MAYNGIIFITLLETVTSPVLIILGNIVINAVQCMVFECFDVYMHLCICNLYCIGDFTLWLSVFCMNVYFNYRGQWCAVEKNGMRTHTHIQSGQMEGREK